MDAKEQAMTLSVRENIRNELFWPIIIPYTCSRIQSLLSVFISPHLISKQPYAFDRTGRIEILWIEGVRLSQAQWLGQDLLVVTVTATYCFFLRSYHVSNF